jgi:hypothetical protein
VTSVTSAILLVAGCVAAPGPSSQPSGSSPSPSASASSAPSPTAERSASAAPESIEPSPEPVPTLVPFPTDVPSVSLPAAIGPVAWGAIRFDEADAGRRAIALGGILGSGPTIEVELLDPLGDPNPVVAGSLVAASVRSALGHLRVRVWHAIDGSIAADLDIVGVDAKVVLDPERNLVYTAAAQAAGGVEIRRRSLDGVTDDLLVTLDKRFTPDGMPVERYGLIVDPDGALIVEACGDADGCRLWEIPPGVAIAPKPRTLPGHPPGLCTLLAATRDWLIVQDDEACFADYSEAPLPVRAIRRADGTSHLITDDHVAIGRVIEVAGRTWVIGADEVFAGSDVRLVRYDVATGKKAVLVPSLPAAANDQTYEVSSTVLPSSWVLLAPWFVESGSIPAIPARLYDVATGESVELPVGTFGWR